MLKMNPKPTDLALHFVVNQSDQNADQMLVEKVAHEMGKKLSQKRDAGYKGWHGPNCTNEILLEALKEHVEKGDMVDVINYAGMILCRSELYGDTA
jgi:hypothetical protein